MGRQRRRQVEVNVRKVKWRNSKGEQSAWVCEYSLCGERHRETQGTNYDKAMERAQQIEREIYDREHTPRSRSLTIAEFAPQVGNDWHDKVANGELRPNTHRMYERVLLKQIVPLLGSELVGDVDTDMCQAIVRQFGKDGHPGKAETFARVISVVMTLAVRKKVRANHPFTYDSIKVGKGCKRREEDMPEMDQLGHLLELVEQSGKWNPRQHDHTALWTEAYFKLALFQGLRLSEGSAVPYKYVDVENGILKIRQTYCKEIRKVVPLTKSENSYRDLPLDPAVAEVLARVNAYPRRRGFGDGTLLDSPRSGICTYSSHRTHFWPRLMTRAGYMHENERGNMEPDFDYHALRHMYGSLLLKKGVDVATAAVMMGDSLETFTRVYAHEIKDLASSREAMRLISQDLRSRTGLSRPVLDLNATILRHEPSK
jgi:integrase